jgi:DNA-binding CsgD family transcriptional regulator
MRTVVALSLQGAWYQELGLTIAALGSERFWRQLEAALGVLLPYDVIMLFAFHGRRIPLVLHHNIEAKRASVVIDDYRRGPYLLDPFLGEVRRGRRSGSVALRQLTPDRFFQSEYYLKHYIRTGLRDEVGIFAPLSPDIVAVLSIARNQAEPLFSRRERMLIAERAPCVSALVERHWQDTDVSVVQQAVASTVPEHADDPEARDALTPREHEVVALVLKGHSSASAADVLGISPGTIKIHRKNAYRKLAISSQAELFSLFIQGHLSMLAPI